ncbi:MAG: helix-turn-helix domain-containing protein [Opitutaceae bacterium]|jgi:hypothetical protein|nr:helix-turn-helix domain-containing protein [Opitutaceae bacterium]
MRDIANLVGLDPSTVSLALRDHPRIAAATRERVRRAAAKLGYAPDPLLSALASYRRNVHERPVTATLGWVNRWSPPKRLHEFREFDACRRISSTSWSRSRISPTSLLWPWIGNARRCW